MTYRTTTYEQCRVDQLVTFSGILFHKSEQGNKLQQSAAFNR